ncbi:iron-sulfur cluster repair di-iron protein [Sinomicrobium soli]|nr:iron-sulfur cluster repair di-iron protein [Sinomicrobium sp. N-1-3-6]
MINKQIGEFVAEDFRTAAVFSKYGIDFCCKGHRTIGEVCAKKGVDQQALLDDLGTVRDTVAEQVVDYKSWPLDLLADYIEKKHHRYVEETVPVLLQYLDKLRKVHGQRHPELLQVYGLFTETAGALSQHMKKEELVLFPFIRKMVKAKQAGSVPERAHFGSVENPIDTMKHEHDEEGTRFREIARITDRYTPPEDACKTYRVAYATLEAFEKDLHLHIHLENNILFPGAVKLQETLS